MPEIPRLAVVLFVAVVGSPVGVFAQAPQPPKVFLSGENPDIK